MALGKQEGVKLVHETVIEGGKILQALGARFFKALEEKYLRARVQLFQKMAQLSHRVIASWNTQDIMHEALDKLLSEILAGEVAIREFP